MVRVCLALAALLMISAFFLVTARFQSRLLYTQLDRLEDQSRQLDTDWRRLQLERAELARQARIDNIARNELNMLSGSPERTIYIRVPGLALDEGVPPGGQP
ncbi:MAG TPA: cell division protein FtsL [Burkholderiaceae bacterium]|nr:cell division protein FtsL [Burkholderiaceae bacterium]